MDAHPDGHRYVLGRVGEPGPDSPLFVQFDGEMWFSQGMEQTLNRAYEAGRIPSMHVFFLHSGGRENRWKELNGDNPIGDYLADVAFPHLRKVHGIQTDPGNIIVNGQSLGGLSSLLAVFTRPEAFGGAIAQSSSLWQPQVMDCLKELEAAGGLDRLSHLKVEIEVGEQEWILVPRIASCASMLRNTTSITFASTPSTAVMTTPAGVALSCRAWSASCLRAPRTIPSACRTACVAKYPAGSHNPELYRGGTPLARVRCE